MRLAYSAIVKVVTLGKMRITEFPPHPNPLPVGREAVSSPEGAAPPSLWEGLREGKFCLKPRRYLSNFNSGVTTVDSHRFLIPASLLLFTLVVVFYTRHAQAAPANPNRQLLNQPVSVLTSTNTISFNWIYSGDQQGVEMGYSVATAGNVNGDNYEDIIIGAPKYEVSGNKNGAAFVFYGSAAGVKSVPDLTLYGSLKGSRFGTAAASAGDVNGDGYDDVIVGAPRYNADQSEECQVYVYYGSAGLNKTPEPDWVITGTQTSIQLGYSVSGAGDVNNDGFADVIIGAPFYDTDIYTDTGAAAGAAYVYLGSEDGLASEPVWVATGPQSGAEFGYSVSGAGDVNNDGFTDVIVGAPFYNTDVFTDGGAAAGAAYVYLGFEGGLASEPVWVATGAQSGAEFGYSVSGAGKVNSDNYGDVVIGAPYTAVDYSNEGAAYLYYGMFGGVEASAGWSMLGGQDSARFGAAVGSASDFDQDGFDEIIIGAPGFDNDQYLEGAIVIYNLGAGTSARAEGNKAETLFGASVATAGDINNDACADIIVGAPEYRIETKIQGQAFVYYGKISVFEAGHSVYLPVVIKGAY